MNALHPGDVRHSATFPSIIADVHTHTKYSHGQASPQDMYNAARRQGLRYIGFSEHSPRPAGYGYPSDYQEKLVRDFPEYVSEVQGIASTGKADGVEVLLGLEADYLPGQEAFTQALIDEYSFDYIIGGLHFGGTWGFDFTADDWASLSDKECFSIYSRYYADLAAMCRAGLFHIAAHPDLVKLFTIETFNVWLDTDEALESVTTALKAIKEYGLLMEISSAGLRKPCKEIYPGPKIMALAAALQVPVSFGSDAHCANTPAYAFDQLARYAASFGYSHSNIVARGKRIPLPFTAPELF